MKKPNNLPKTICSAGGNSPPTEQKAFPTGGTVCRLKCAKAGKKHEAQKVRPAVLWAVLSALLICLTAASLILGAAGTLETVIKQENGWVILRHVRLPRTVACIITGAALSCAGLLLQAALNNTLASPGIIGVNSGSGLFVVLAAIAFPGSLIARTTAAFTGALICAFLVYGIAKAAGVSRSTIIMAGVAVSSLFSALIDTLITLFPGALTDRSSFSVGGFQNVTESSLRPAVPVLLIALAVSILFSRKLDILILGDEVAHSLGLRVGLCRAGALFLAAALSAGAVSVAGLLSFLGLIVPHIMRTAVGTASYRRLTLLTVLGGADFALFCDILARMLFRPYEIPVGIILSCLGVPFFLFLLLGKGRRHRFD